jgi:hypothetical protein
MDIIDYLLTPNVASLNDANNRSIALARRMATLNKKRKDEMETLRTAIAKLMLVVETQHRMLVKKGVCSEEEFGALLREVDLEDGTADGQRRRR